MRGGLAHWRTCLSPEASLICLLRSRVNPAASWVDHDSGHGKQIYWTKIVYLRKQTNMCLVCAVAFIGLWPVSLIFLLYLV